MGDSQEREGSYGMGDPIWWSPLRSLAFRDGKVYVTGALSRRTRFDGVAGGAILLLLSLVYLLLFVCLLLLLL